MTRLFPQRSQRDREGNAGTSEAEVREAGKQLLITEDWSGKAARLWDIGLSFHRNSKKQHVDLRW